MIDHPQPSITVNVDVTNPGQFFACCALLELADRLWPRAEGWFASNGCLFHMTCDGTLSGLVDAIAHAELIHADPTNLYSSPVIVGEPFRRLIVDWWETDQTGARDLKVWAGRMESFGIAQAMQHALREEQFRCRDLFDIGLVVTNPHSPGKKNNKREPYYFDARRAPNAHSRDIGFSPNDLSLTTIAHPAVELLCLVGLQVARPVPTDRVRVYDYFIWFAPITPSLLLAASTGRLDLSGRRGYRFENWFRTGQKKHKAFRSAIPLM